MSIAGELVEHYKEGNRRGLARLMEHCDPGAATIVDNSVLTSFVGRRLKHGEYMGLNLFQIFGIEHGFNQDLVTHMDGNFSLPNQTRNEYARGTERLGTFVDPLKALRFRWSMPNLEIPSYDARTYLAAQEKLEDFMENMANLNAAFKCFKTEAYFGEKEWERANAFRGIFRGIADLVKERNREAIYKRGRHNDADIFAKAYALANKMPVQILTGDHHFRQIQEEFYKNEDIVAVYAGMPSSTYPVNVVLDMPKKPRVIRPNRLGFIAV